MEAAKAQRGFVVAVDGVASVGKSGFCRELAQRLGYKFLGTGEIYRAFTLMVLNASLNLKIEKDIEGYLRDEAQYIGFQHDKICLRGVPFGDEIRTPEVSFAVPTFSKIPGLRQIVLPIQHAFAEGNNIVAEGRDMTSVVFPEADVKIFMTAALEKRAWWRLSQYVEQMGEYNPNITYEKVLEELRVRDYEDIGRKHSPLVRVPGATVIDTTNMTKLQVVEALLEACEHLATR